MHPIARHLDARRDLVQRDNAAEDNGSTSFVRRFRALQIH